MLSQQQEYTDIEFDFPGHQDAQTQNEIPTELLKLSRRYCISLDPSFIPAIGPFIEVLLRSGVHRYADFKLLDAIALLETTRTSASEVSRFKRVPMSKEDVFNEKDVSLLDKRRIVKFLQLALGDFEAEIQADENLKSTLDP
jgi:RAB protein geranylgeranyltransferase component A